MVDMVRLNRYHNQITLMGDINQLNFRLPNDSFTIYKLGQYCFAKCNYEDAQTKGTFYVTGWLPNGDTLRTVYGYFEDDIKNQSAHETIFNQHNICAAYNKFYILE